SGLVCIALLCGGFFMSLIDLTHQYDEAGTVYLTASNASGLILVLLSLGTFFWIFTSAWPGAQEMKAAKKKEESVTQAKTASLEHALSLLVMDFIKEREQKRERYAREHYNPTAEKESPSLHDN
ncbi:MAG TPA: hypothetical protein VIG33_07130, partial [Pseudobdellovibrionaceae bacterium]